MINKLNNLIASTPSATTTTSSGSGSFDLNPVDLITGGGVTDVSQISTMSTLVGFIFNIVMGVGAAVVFVNLGLAFVNYITASGDPKNLEKANKHLYMTGIALLIVLASWGIRTAIINSIGLRQADIYNGSSGGGGGGSSCVGRGSSCNSTSDCCSGICNPSTNKCSGL